HLLARYAITTPTTSLHEHNEHKKAPSLIERLQKGESVALVSDAGTPTVSDPGQRLIRMAIDAGIRVEAIPGPSAPVAALAASGISADTFTFMGFPPTRSNDRSRWLADVRSAGRPVVFFEAPHRILRTLKELQNVAGDQYVVVARELTKAHEELVRGPISTVLEHLPEPRGEFTVVLDIGRSTDYARHDLLDVTQIVSEFGSMTANERSSKRAAIKALAKRYGVSANTVYAAIEQDKKSGE